MIKQWLVLIFLVLACYSNAEEKSPIEQSFFLDFSEVEGTDIPSSGTLINPDNLSRYESLFDPLIAKLIGEGKLTVEVGTAENFPVHPSYIDATREHWQDTALGDEPGIINNYIAGRPFPEPLDVNDPSAGDKAAWNMRYGYMPDENEVEKFYWQYRNMRTGKLERQLAMYGAILRFKHRHNEQGLRDLPTNPGELFNAMYLRVEKPHDVRNTQLLIHRREDDTLNENAWMYTNTQRRVRRLATGQTTDAFLGSDIMIEDFLGYNGRIKDQQWVYQGSEWLLMPYYRHQPPAESADEFKMGSFHGQGNCFPDVSWQLRKVHKLDAIPKNAGHPLSKRSYYLDAQNFGPALTKIYDRAGRLWKLGIIGVSDSRYHHPANREWQSGIADLVSMIDLQAEHCTTIQLLPRIPKKPLRPNQFTQQYLRARGR